MNRLADISSSLERHTFLDGYRSGRLIANYSARKDEEVIVPMETRFWVGGDPLVRPSRQDVVHRIEIDAMPVDPTTTIANASSSECHRPRLR